MVGYVSNFFYWGVRVLRKYGRKKKKSKELRLLGWLDDLE